MMKSYKDSKNCDQSDCKSEDVTSLRFSPKKVGFKILKDDTNCITRYSDIQVEYSIYSCHECNFRGRYETLRYHIRAEHNKEPREYISKHRCLQIIEKILHKCKICGETYSCNHGTLSIHICPTTK